MNWSYWEKTSLTAKKHVIIIGAGITGLNAAIRLKMERQELEIGIIERGVFSAGASSKNAGFCCFGSLSELMADLESNSMDEVLSLVEKRYRGLGALRSLIGDHKLDYQGLGGFEVFTDSLLYDKCSTKMDSFNVGLKEIVGDNVYSDADHEITTYGLRNIQHLIRNNYEGQIDTGKMLSSLSKLAQELGVEVFNGVEVQSINGQKILCRNGLVFEGDQILIATNGFANKLLDIDVKPARAQVLITQPIKELKIKGSFHFDEGFYYFRNIHGRLLIGGGRNVNFEAEETTEMRTTTEIQDAITYIIDHHILDKNSYKIDYAWSGIMGVGKVKSPIIKTIDDHTTVAVRLGGMGVAIGTLVGQEAAEIVLEKFI